MHTSASLQEVGVTALPWQGLLAAGSQSGSQAPALLAESPLAATAQLLLRWMYHCWSHVCGTSLPSRGALIAILGLPLRGPPWPPVQCC